MNILILGASSDLGAELAVKFSHGNAVFLQGRNIPKLNKTRKKCLLQHPQ